MKYQYFLCFNEDYKWHALVAILSIVQNVEKVDETKICILTADLTNSTKEEIRKICDSINVSFFNFSYVLPADLNYHHHFNEANYYRLFVAEIFESGRCLYLDTDVIVTGSLEHLFELNLNSNCIAAVEDVTFKNHEKLGLARGVKYFNSGVLMIDIPKWRKAKIRERVIDAVIEKSSLIQFVDQCGLNLVLNGEWEILDHSYNFQTGHLVEFSAKDIPPLPAIIHFTGSEKPSHFANNHPFRSIYWQYRNQTAGKRVVGEGFSLRSLVRKIIQFSQRLSKR